MAKPGPIALLATQFRHSTRRLCISKGLRDLVAKMITSAAGVPTFNKAEIEDMVDSLENKFILLDAEAFTLLIQILVATESCQAQSEGLFKCLDVLERRQKDNIAVTDAQRKTFKAVAKKTTSGLLQFFLDHRKQSIARRWAGLLLFELLEFKDNRENFLHQHQYDESFKALGKIIILGMDKILKIISGRIIAQLVVDFTGDDKRALLDRFLVGIDDDSLTGTADVPPVSFPLLGSDPEVGACTPSGTHWDVGITEYVGHIETMRENQGKRSPMGFGALCLTIGSEEDPIGIGGNITCNVDTILSFHIPPSGQSLTTWIDIDFLNVESVELVGARDPEKDLTANLEFRLKDNLETDCLFLLDMVPRTQPNKMTLEIYLDEADLILADLQKCHQHLHQKFQELDSSQVPLVSALFKDIHLFWPSSSSREKVPEEEVLGHTKVEDQKDFPMSDGGELKHVPELEGVKEKGTPSILPSDAQKMLLDAKLDISSPGVVTPARPPANTKRPRESSSVSNRTVAAGPSKQTPFRLPTMKAAAPTVAPPTAETSALAQTSVSKFTSINKFYDLPADTFSDIEQVVKEKTAGKRPAEKGKQKASKAPRRTAMDDTDNELEKVPVRPLPKTSLSAAGSSKVETRPKGADIPETPTETRARPKNGKQTPRQIAKDPSPPVPEQCSLPGILNIPSDTEQPRLKKKAKAAVKGKGKAVAVAKRPVPVRPGDGFDLSDEEEVRPKKAAKPTKAKGTTAAASKGPVLVPADNVFEIPADSETAPKKTGKPTTKGKGRSAAAPPKAVGPKEPPHSPPDVFDIPSDSEVERPAKKARKAPGKAPKTPKPRTPKVITKKAAKKAAASARTTKKTPATRAKKARDVDDDEDEDAEGSPPKKQKRNHSEGPPRPNLRRSARLKDGPTPKPVIGDDSSELSDMETPEKKRKPLQQQPVKNQTDKNADAVGTDEDADVQNEPESELAPAAAMSSEVQQDPPSDIQLVQQESEKIVEQLSGPEVEVPMTPPAKQKAQPVNTPALTSGSVIPPIPSSEVRTPKTISTGLVPDTPMKEREVPMPAAEAGRRSEVDHFWNTLEMPDSSRVASSASLDYSPPSQLEVTVTLPEVPTKHVEVNLVIEPEGVPAVKVVEVAEDQEARTVDVVVAVPNEPVQDGMVIPCSYEDIDEELPQTLNEDVGPIPDNENSAVPEVSTGHNEGRVLPLVEVPVESPEKPQPQVPKVKSTETRTPGPLTTVEKTPIPKAKLRTPVKTPRRPLPESKASTSTLKTLAKAPQHEVSRQEKSSAKAPVAPVWTPARKAALDFQAVMKSAQKLPKTPVKVLPEETSPFKSPTKKTPAVTTTPKMPQGLNSAKPSARILKTPGTAQRIPITPDLLSKEMADSLARKPQIISWGPEGPRNQGSLTKLQPFGAALGEEVEGPELSSQSLHMRLAVVASQSQNKVAEWLAPAVKSDPKKVDTGPGDLLSPSDQSDAVNLVGRPTQELLIGDKVQSGPEIPDRIEETKVKMTPLEALGKATELDVVSPAAIPPSDPPYITSAERRILHAEGSFVQEEPESEPQVLPEPRKNMIDIVVDDEEEDEDDLYSLPTVWVQPKQLSIIAEEDEDVVVRPLPAIKTPATRKVRKIIIVGDEDQIVYEGEQTPVETRVELVVPTVIRARVTPATVERTVTDAGSPISRTQSSQVKFAQPKVPIRKVPSSVDGEESSSEEESEQPPPAVHGPLPKIKLEKQDSQSPEPAPKKSETPGLSEELAIYIESDKSTTYSSENGSQNGSIFGAPLVPPPQQKAPQKAVAPPALILPPAPRNVSKTPAKVEAVIKKTSEARVRPAVPSSSRVPENPLDVPGVPIRPPVLPSSRVSEKPLKIVPAPERRRSAFNGKWPLETPPLPANAKSGFISRLTEALHRVTRTTPVVAQEVAMPPDQGRTRRLFLPEIREVEVHDEPEDREGPTGEGVPSSENGRFFVDMQRQGLFQDGRDNEGDDGNAEWNHEDDTRVPQGFSSSSSPSGSSDRVFSDSEEGSEVDNTWREEVPEYHRETLAVLDKISQHWISFLMSSEDRLKMTLEGHKEKAGQVVQSLRELHMAEHAKFQEKQMGEKAAMGMKCKEARVALDTMLKGNLKALDVDDTMERDVKEQYGKMASALDDVLASL